MSGITIWYSSPLMPIGGAAEYTLIPVSLLPWTGPALYGTWRHRHDGAEYQFMMIWALGTILFYTLVATKYPTYAYIANIPLLLYAGHWGLV